MTSCSDPVGLASGAAIYLIGVTIPFLVLLLSHIALEVFFILRKVGSNTFHFGGVHAYSLVHLAVPKLEKLISRTLLGLLKIRLLFPDRVRSQNFKN